MIRRDWLKTLLAAGAMLLTRTGFGSGSAVAVDGSSLYQRLVDQVRDAFPSPVRSRVSDSRFSRLLAFALGEYERLKGERTYLGKREPLDYARARDARLAKGPVDVHATIRESASYLQGMYTWSHPNVHRLHGLATSASIIGQLYGSMVDANIVWDDLSYRVAEAEVRVVAMCADLIGYDARFASGLFTFGGTGTTFYGIKLGLEKAQPQAFQKGVRDSMKIFASDVAHYAKLSCAAWLGLGSDSLVTVPSGADNAISLAGLEAALRGSLGRQEKIAAIVVTMGSTDAFGIDDLEAVYALRARLVEEFKLSYVPHLHADAVVGWSYCVFNDYDFGANPLGIPTRGAADLARLRERLRHLHLADSVGLDFHKSGYTPYMSSLFLVSDARELSSLRRDRTEMPYLFQFGEYEPGLYTLECSRSGGPVLAALANLTLLGRDGYRALLAHCVEMSSLLRDRAATLPWLAVANEDNVGPVVVLRVYPDGVDAQSAYARERDDEAERASLLRINRYNAQVFHATREAAEQGDSPVFVETARYRASAYGEPIVAIKCFTLSVFTDSQAIDAVIDALDKGRRKAELKT